ncbi:MAG TPA: ABC transporter substrate-binding protein, partial [Mobilitalea sp.]|nr:ABC transporter substrate-binding protein [Mobilitalea sp.]
TIKTWDDVDALLSKVKTAYPDMNLLVPPVVNDGILNGMVSTKLEEIQSGAGISFSSTDTKAVNIYATDEYKEICERAYDWNQKGYFLPDAATNTETRNSLISAGNAFGYIVGSMSPGFITQETNSNGTEMVGTYIGDSTLTTSNVSFAQWTVPTACENPEKALAFLNLLYSDPEIQNLFLYGVEGTDYQVKDAAKDIIGFPDGKDSSTVGYTNQTWISGNASIAHIWETDSPTVWTDLADFNNNAKKSALYGFAYDTSNIRNEITAISNVKSKYCAILESGMADVEETLGKFNSELESAGIQNVIDDMQSQIDAWAKSK